MGFVATRRLDDAIPRRLDHGERDLTHLAIVVNDKDCPSRFDHLPNTSTRPQTDWGANHSRRAGRIQG
jgi:hypothetical protein